MDRSGQLGFTRSAFARQEHIESALRCLICHVFDRFGLFTSSGEVIQQFFREVRCLPLMGIFVSGLHLPQELVSFLHQRLQTRCVLDDQEHSLITGPVLFGQPRKDITDDRPFVQFIDPVFNWPRFAVHDAEEHLAQL